MAFEGVPALRNGFKVAAERDFDRLGTGEQIPPGHTAGREQRDPDFSLLGFGRGLLCARGTLVRLSLEQKKRFYYPRLSAVKSSATLAAYPGQTALWVTSRR